MLMNPCLQAAREAKEGAAKAADEAESKGDVVKQEKVEKIADAANTQDAKICVDFEPCKKTEGCSRLCPIGQKHRGAVGGKMLKPHKMQTGDDEPKWLAHAGCILREKAP